jgi:ribosomal protein S18 acetylase RimI-like enzyme
MGHAQATTIGPGPFLQGRARTASLSRPRGSLRLGLISSAAVDGLEITRGSDADIPNLEALWVSVHNAHRASMPELAPYVSDEETWRERRALYEDLFRRPDTFLLLARSGGELVGYALGHVAEATEGWTSDTWVTGDRIGELESLAVLPGRRGAGIGSALLDAVDREFERIGVRDVIVGVLPGNMGAIRLYERRGFRPTWLYLSRFDGRH